MRITTIACLISILILAVSCEKEGLIGSFRDSRDGNRYKMVRIGDQIWMAENLAYLPNVSPSTSKSLNDPFYYVYGYESKNISEAKKNFHYLEYGALYNWAAAIESCPKGWHLPSISEMNHLIVYLDSARRFDAFRMKSESGWNLGGNGDNSSRFNVKPAGFLGGKFAGKGSSAWFWASSTVESPNGWCNSNCWRFNYSMDNSSLGYNWCDMGFSIRCVKDTP